MNARLKPIASKHENGRIAVYVGATYSYLPRESALSLFQQLGMALDLPYSEGVARYAAQMLAAARMDGVGDIDGGYAEDSARENELLEPFGCPRGGCGDDCQCSEGDECMRLSAIGRELVQFIEVEPVPLREVGL